MSLHVETGSSVRTTNGVKRVRSGNSSRLEASEVLAQRIEVTTEDDSYASRGVSILEQDLDYEEGVAWYHQAPFLWGMNVCALLLACLVVPYERWAPCPAARGWEDKRIRRGQMPPANWLDRLMRRVCARFMKPISFERWLTGPKQLNKLLGWLLHPIVTVIREGVTTSQALDAVYAAKCILLQEFRELKWYQWLWLPRVVGRALALYIMCTPHPAGVRNRLRSVFRHLQSVGEALEAGEELVLHELACGSSECTTEFVWDANQRFPDASIRVVLVDTSPSSLRRARRHAQELGVDEGQIQYIEDNLQEYLATIPSGTLKHLVVVGFLDYRDDPSLEGYLREFLRVLAPGGVLVVSMIMKSKFDFMLKRLIGWPLLIHRTPAEFELAFYRAGWLAIEKKWFEVESQGTHLTAIFCQEAAA